MKKTLLSISAIFAVFIFSIFSYVSFIFVPNQIEHIIYNALIKNGYQHFGYSDVKRERGAVFLSDIVLDKDGFFTVEQARISLSLIHYFLGYDRYISVSLTKPRLTRDLSHTDTADIALFLNGDFASQFLDSIHISKLKITGGRADLLTRDFSGVTLNFDGTAYFTDSEFVNIDGILRSSQKDLTFYATYSGDYYFDGRINLDVRADNITFRNYDIDIKRGHINFNFHTLNGLENFEFDGEYQISSLTYYGLPLSTVRGRINMNNEKHSVLADGATFGKENILWFSQMTGTYDSPHYNITIKPVIVKDALAFLKRNTIIDKNIDLPDSIRNIKSSPIEIILSTDDQDKSIRTGTFSTTLSGFDLQSAFKIEDGTIRGQYKIPAQNLHIPIVADDSVFRPHFSFVPSGHGKFALKRRQHNKPYNLLWSSVIDIKDGILDYGLFQIKDISGQIVDGHNIHSSFQSLIPLSFSLPLKNHIPHQGHVMIDMNGDYNNILNNLTLDIYDGHVVTLSPLYENGEIKPDNVFQVSDIDLSKLFQDAEFDNIFIDGVMGGIIPFNIKEDRGIFQMDVRGGILQSQSTGILRLDETMAASLFPGNTTRIMDIREALKNYHYEYFEVRLDGDLSNRIMMTLSASGSNPDMKRKGPITLKLQIETQISLFFDALLKPSNAQD